MKIQYKGILLGFVVTGLSMLTACSTTPATVAMPAAQTVSSVAPAPAPKVHKHKHKKAVKATTVSDAGTKDQPKATTGDASESY